MTGGPEWRVLGIGASRLWRPALLLALIVAGKATGLLRDVLLTFYEGVSSVTDAYFLSSSISALIYMAVYASVPVLAIPMYTKARSTDADRGDRERLRAAFLLLLSASLLLTLLVLVFGDWIIFRVATDADPIVHRLAGRYLPLMALTFSLSTAVAICNSVQSVNGRVVPSYVVPVANNLFFCTGLMLFGGAEQFEAVILVSVVGWCLLLGLNLIRVARSILEVWPGPQRVAGVERSVLLLLLPAAVSFYIEQGNTFIGTYFAAELPGHAVSIWSYANKISLIFLSVFLVFLTTYLFPRIAQLAAGDGAELGRYLVQCMRAVTVLALPALAFMCEYAEEIVSLLFRRGSFGENDVREVAPIFSMVILAMPLVLVRDVMNRVFFSYGMTVLPCVFSLVALGIGAGGAWLASGPLGLWGVAMAMLISVAVHAVCVVILVQRKLHARLFVSWTSILMKSSVAAAFASISVRALDGWLSAPWVLLALPFLVLYAVVLRLLAARELAQVRSLAGPAATTNRSLR